MMVLKVTWEAYGLYLVSSVDGLCDARMGSRTIRMKWKNKISCRVRKLEWEVDTFANAQRRASRSGKASPEHVT